MCDPALSGCSSSSQSSISARDAGLRTGVEGSTTTTFAFSMSNKETACLRTGVERSGIEGGPRIGVERRGIDRGLRSGVIIIIVDKGLCLTGVVGGDAESCRVRCGGVEGGEGEVRSASSSCTVDSAGTDSSSWSAVSC